MRCTVVQFLHDPHNLFQFLHQVVFVVQSASRIGNQDVSLTCLRRLQRIEQYGCRVGTGMLRNHRHIIALAPYLQLFNRRRTEGIAGGQHHALALILELLGQLTDGGGFTHTINTHHQDHVRLVAGIDFQRCLNSIERILQFRDQRFVQRIRVFQFFA